MRCSDILEKYHMFVCSESSEQVAEEGAADAENNLVSSEQLSLRCNGDISEFFILEELMCSSEEE